VLSLVINAKAARFLVAPARKVHLSGSSRQPAAKLMAKTNDKRQHSIQM